MMSVKITRQTNKARTAWLDAMSVLRYGFSTREQVDALEVTYRALSAESDRQTYAECAAKFAPVDF